MRVIIFILFLYLFYTVSCDPYVEHVINSNIPTKNADGGCSFSFSILTNASQGNIISDQDFKIVNPVNTYLTTKLFSEKDGYSLFNFEFQVNSIPINTTQIDIVLNLTTRWDSAVYSYNMTFYCKDINMDLFYLSYLGKTFFFPTVVQALITPLEIGFNMTFNQKFYFNYKCSTVSPFLCAFNNVPNSNLLQLYTYLYPPYNITLPENIPISFSFIDRSINFTIPNIFPYNVTRTSKNIEIEFYPPSGYTMIQDDYQLSYDRIQFLYVENSNSLYTLFYKISQTFVYYLVVQNETHSTYVQPNYIAYDILPGDDISYMYDFNSTEISNNYTVSYQPKSIVGSMVSNFIFDSESSCYMIYGKNEISNITTETFSYYISLSALSIKFIYPIGFNSTSNNYVYSSVAPINIFKPEPNFIFFSPGGQSTITMDPPLINYDKSLLLNSVEFIDVSWQVVIMRLNVSSNCSTAYIQFGATSFVPIEQLIEGDTFNGVYECPILPHKETNEYLLTLQDRCGGIYTFSDSLYYQPDQLIFPKFPNSLGKNFDSRNDANVLIYIRLSSPIKFYDTYFIAEKFKSQIYGNYDESLDLYVFNITFTKGYPSGPVYYGIFFANMIDSTFLESNFGSNATIISTNTYSDLLAPTISRIVAFPSNMVLIDENQEISIGWNITIKDYPNGFKSGAVNIYSNIDFLPRYYILNSSNLIEGDKYEGVYSINFTIKGICKSQTFSILNFTLADYGVYQNPLIRMNPLTTMYGSRYEDQLKINLDCTTSILDENPPILKNFSFTDSVDVGKLNREVHFNLTVSDIGTSGISERHNPIVHLTSDNGNFVEVTTKLFLSGPNTKLYIGSTQLPYGFGFNTILVSVYGLVDNFYNYNGYTSIDLKNNSFPYYIKRYHSLVEPILERASILTSSGGQLVLFGKSFGYDNSTFSVYIDYQNGSGYQKVETNIYTFTILRLELESIKSSFILAKVIRNGIESNELNIPVKSYISPKPTTTPNTPTPTPTPTQTDRPKCPGVPECSNNGECIDSICHCSSQWYGPSCSSKIDIRPFPPPFSQPNTGTNITVNGKVIKTTMEIIGIRELDPTNNEVNRFDFKSWNLKDLTTPISNPKYNYSTQLDQRSTFVNVTIEYFNNSTNISFANEDLYIPQSTIKFSIFIDHYQFKSNTNILQVLMKSTIEHDNSDECSSIGVGKIDNVVQWIKLTIGDRSLYGRFLAKGIIDDRVTSIQNLIIDDNQSEQTKQSRSIVVGITIPKYDNHVYLDPDFTNLVDFDSKDTENEICPKKKKLSSGAIAGIVVGVIVAVSLVVAIVLYTLKRRKFKKQEKIMRHKLEQLNKDR